jgi:hypothetical protein
MWDTDSDIIWYSYYLGQWLKKKVAGTHSVLSNIVKLMFQKNITGFGLWIHKNI